MSAFKRPTEILELGEPLVIAMKRTKYTTNQLPTSRTNANPDPSQLTDVYQMVTKLRSSMKLLKSCCVTLPTLRSAVEKSFDILNLIQVPACGAQSTREIESDLVRWIITLSAYLSSIQPRQMSERIEYFCKTLQEQMERINIQKAYGRTNRLLETKQELDQFRQSFRRIEAALCRLQADTSLNSWRLRNEKLMDSKLRKMLPVMDALHDSTHSNLVKRHAYYPDTMSSFESVYGWAHGLGTESICWMNAGTGKTTIAYSLCAELERNGRLGASLFCSHSCSASVDVARIFPTVAYQLAQLSRPFRWTLCKALESIPDYSKQDLGHQFETLIVAPFLEVRELLPSGLVVVIDTLDECLDMEASNLVLDILLSQANNLPIRFFITSHANNPVSRIASSQNDGNLLVISPNTTREEQVNTNGLFRPRSSDALEDKQAAGCNFSAGFRIFHGLHFNTHVENVFNQQRDLDDTVKDIQSVACAHSPTPDKHSDLLPPLTCAGEAPDRRFGLLIELADVQKVIECTSTVLILTPEDDPGLPRLLDTLGAAHSQRFQRLGEIHDLEKAIECEARALALTSEDHPDLQPRFAHLAASHKARFQRLGELHDLEKAIECGVRVLALTPDGHPDMSSRLANLAASHEARFQRLGELHDLEKAIECGARALALIPDGHPDMSSRLANLAASHEARFQRLGELHDLEKAIECGARALAVTPEDHPYMPRWLFDLGKYRSYQHQRLSEHDELEKATTIETLAVGVASVAISSSDYDLALEWLEHARCVVWNNILLCLPLGQLQSSHPSLAVRPQTVADRLHRVSSEPRESGALPPGPMTTEQVAQEHQRLAEEYNHLLSKARTLSGFECFVQPMKANSLLRAARQGPIVVINCHEERCDALLVLPEQNHVDHLLLPNFNREKARWAYTEIETSLRYKRLRERGVKQRGGLGQNVKFGSVLMTLWDDIVEPVLDYLGYMNNSAGNSPHITWCPTGPISLLPLHAAGNYAQPRSRVFDYVVSSYTPTLTALLASSPSSLNHDSRILAIGLETTSGHNRLPSTAKELAYVKAHTVSKSRYSQLMDKQATTTAVLDAMEQHDWVHLACHAHQNVNDPTKSGFFLYEGTLDLAAINRRSFKNKGLAFLSACQTAIDDQKLHSEAVHLASGMLMAGYSSVIATMWSVIDEDMPYVVDKVYGQLMKEGKLGNGEAGKALHDAVAELRGKVGEEEFERWVPYIHIGS
ncbi:unnamed protein product [Rhizoctonia solani]|uniref:Uncharacterized protein n=1 Tax=Rhizoctonia solani TaxID=456999 RepID=A0A8H3A5N5_9AGAM|nr:unnamed protein product [Rhizoctonia solani]